MKWIVIVLAVLTMGVMTLGGVLVLTNVAFTSFPTPAAANRGGLLWDTTSPGGAVRVSSGAAWQLTDGAIGYVDQLSTQFVSVSSVSVGAGRARSDDGLSYIVLSGTVTADITVSGVNGLDTGAEAASTWYFVWVIADSTAANAPATLLSASSTSPSMPAGYDRKRRVGAVRNDATPDFVNFRQFGSGHDRKYLYLTDINTRQALVNGVAGVATAVSVAAFVPPTSRDVFTQYRSTAPLVIIYGDITLPIYTIALPGNDIMLEVPTTAAQDIGYSNFGIGLTGIWIIGFEESL